MKQRRLKTNLKERQEVVKLFASSPLVEIGPGGLEKSGDQANAEVFVREVDRIDTSGSRRTAVAESQDLVHHVENNRMLKKAIRVKLPEILDLGEAPLVHAKIVEL